MKAAIRPGFVNSLRLHVYTEPTQDSEVVCKLRYLTEVEVDLKHSCRHYLDVTHDRFILGVLVVEHVALGTHIACYVENLLAHICTVLRLNDMTHKALRMLTIVLEHDTALRIWQLFGLQLKVLA